ncbi:MAG: hypothetical protein QOG75_1333, partial [Mycobacterium sp.]|nr:hypothetical protein [Mycobacterium sp.]
MLNQRLKWQAIAIAASGIVTVGALAAAVGQEQTATAASGNMNIAGTTTSTTPAPAPPVAIASPTMKSPGPRAFSDTGGLSPAGRRRRRQCRGRHQWPATPWEVREFSYLWSRSALDPTRGPDKEAGSISPPAPLIASAASVRRANVH